MAAVEKELRKHLERAIAQGWEVRQTKNGYLLVPPDKSKELVAIHRTPSDWRALKNTLAAMKRSGYREED